MGKSSITYEFNDTLKSGMIEYTKTQSKMSHEIDEWLFLHNNHIHDICSWVSRLQLQRLNRIFSHRKNMINLSNRLLKKVVGKLNRMKKGKT